MKARIYPEFLPPDFQPNADFARRYAVLLQDWRSQRVLAPDLATYFAAQRTAQSEPLYFKADIHWTPSGAELAAMEFARQIRQANILPPSPRPGVTLGPYQTMRYDLNDLGTLLPPEEQKKLALQMMRLRRPVVKTGGSALLDDGGAADVTVIGNSYMQADYTFPTVLSAELNRPVELLWKPARTGHFAVLLEYLRSSLFRQQRPKLLVWHMLEGNMEILPSDAGTWGAEAIPTESFYSEIRRQVNRG